MCKSIAEGGQRCAAHTRPAAETALTVLNGIPEHNPINITENHRQALVEFASTPTGYQELEEELKAASRNDDMEREVYLQGVLKNGQQMREANEHARFANMYERIRETPTTRHYTEEAIERDELIEDLGWYGAGNFDYTHVSYGMHNPLRGLSDRDRAMLWEKGDGDLRKSLLGGLISDSRVPFYGVRGLQLGPHWRKAVVENPDPRQLYILAKKIKPPFSDEEVLTMLEKSPGGAAAAALYGNPAHRAVITDWMMNEPRGVTLRRFAAGGKLDADTMDKLAESQNPVHRRAVAISSHLSPRALKKLATDHDVSVRMAVANGSTAPGGMARIGKVRSFHGHVTSGYVTPKDAAEILINDSDPKVATATFSTFVIDRDDEDDYYGGPYGTVISDEGRHLYRLATPQRQAELREWARTGLTYGGAAKNYTDEQLHSHLLGQ